MEILDFYADWCGPCQMMKPTMEEFEKAHPEIKVTAVNIDEEEELAEKYKIFNFYHFSSSFARSEARMFTKKEIIRSTKPRASANSKLPLFVSSIIAVVITLVFHWMLPPTMLTAPTSAIDLPKAVSITEESAILFCERKSLIVLILPKERPFAVSSRLFPLTEHTPEVRLITTGVMRRHWATTITSTVKSIPREPKGPYLVNSR